MWGRREHRRKREKRGEREKMKGKGAGYISWKG